MKKIIAVLAALALGTAAFAQVGISTQYSFRENSNDAYLATGVGVSVKIPLFLGFAVQAGATANIYTMNVESADQSNIYQALDFSNLPVFSFPLQLQWGINLGPIRPYVGAEYTIMNNPTSPSSDKYRSFGDTAAVIAGLQLGKCQVAVSYGREIDPEIPLLDNFKSLADEQPAGPTVLKLSIVSFF